ncbi:MAG TPA: metalloregulator ArsR/SmtB family transcription factor [Acidobacteriaceae bacterium]|nr:metalloregulator ArsR/SmtB family transcription factor [Acidobacteriaceae bacterium]
MTPPSIVKSLRVLADASRLRMLLMLQQEELSVAELQDILLMGQSTISTHLSQMKHAGLVEDRRAGKNILYRSKRPDKGNDSAGELLPQLAPLLEQAAREIPEAAVDQAALQIALSKRRDKTRAFFDEMAGRLGREYVPGRSWKSIAETLLQLLPPMVIADLGAGEGALSLLLAQSATQVIAVDNSDRMVELGAELAAREGAGSLEYRKGDMEDVPIANSSVDLALFSQSLHHAIHPERAVHEAWRILKPGGRIAVLDLVKHRFEEARELYADLWLGFSEVELQSLLSKAGFAGIHTSVVHKETEAPHFQTVLAMGRKQED